jgi:hypothetical protein
MLGTLMTGDLLWVPGLGQLFSGEFLCCGGHATSVGGAALAARRGQ